MTYISEIVRRNAFLVRRRGRVALSMDGVCYSYKLLWQRINRVANAFRGLGIQPGDRVAILLENGPAWPELLFGLSEIGAVSVAINVLLNGREADYIICDSGAVALVAGRVAARALSDISEWPSVLVRVNSFKQDVPGRWLDYEQLLDVASDKDSSVQCASADPAMMLYTSGTTGHPKGAMHSHDGILWNAFHQIADAGLSEQDTYLLVPSLSWSAGFHDITLPLLWLGGKITMLPTGGLTIDRIVHAVHAEQATITLLVPTLLKQLAASPGALKKLRRSPLRKIFTGGETVPPSVVAEINAALPDCKIIQIYGMSEFPLMMTIFDDLDGVDHPGITGRATSIVTIGVEQPNGDIRDVGEGEVVIRSPASMLGYHNLPHASDEAFRHGWFHTGDAGIIDEQGYLTLNGRAKDMIISGGLNIYPREIEDLVISVPEIDDVAVVGVPDRKWGEVPVVIAVTKNTDEPVEKMILSVCDNLSSFKRPRNVLVRREPLPRTPTGKVLKRELRPWAERKVSK